MIIEFLIKNSQTEAENPPSPSIVTPNNSATKRLAVVSTLLNDLVQHTDENHQLDQVDIELESLAENNRPVESTENQMETQEEAEEGPCPSEITNEAAEDQLKSAINGFYLDSDEETTDSSRPQESTQLRMEIQEEVEGPNPSDTNIEAAQDGLESAINEYHLDTDSYPGQESNRPREKVKSPNPSRTNIETAEDVLVNGFHSDETASTGTKDELAADRLELLINQVPLLSSDEETRSSKMSTSSRKRRSRRRQSEPASRMQTRSSLIRAGGIKEINASFSGTSLQILNKYSSIIKPCYVKLARLNAGELKGVSYPAKKEKKRAGSEEELDRRINAIVNLNGLFRNSKQSPSSSQGSTLLNTR